MGSHRIAFIAIHGSDAMNQSKWQKLMDKMTGRNLVVYANELFNGPAHSLHLSPLDIVVVVWMGTIFDVTIFCAAWEIS